MIIALALSLTLCADTVGGKPYTKLATRAATVEHMHELVAPEHVRVGEAWCLSSFPYAGFAKNDLDTRLEPEEQLATMRAGAAGPDLARKYKGKKGLEVSWKSLGHIDNQSVDLRGHKDDELDNLAIAYIYIPLVADSDTTFDVDCGSDDGLRLWFNGTLIVDHDVPRSLDPHDEHLHLVCKQGINHMLAKVAQGQGGWSFQILSRKDLGGAVDAELEYLLDHDFPPFESRRFYRVNTFPLPDELVLEVGGIGFLHAGKPLVCTRRGDVMAVANAYEEPPRHAQFSTFASGLHEPLGLAVRQDADGEAVYCVQRGELTRLVDKDGDGRADLYDTFCDAWGISGNYHEFAFGPKFDREGNAWVTLNVGFCGGLGKSVVPYRGWAVKITPQREMIPVCDGLRSPNGIGMFTDGTMFYADNQGDYVATNKIAELTPGSWHGHPSSLRWRTDLAASTDRPPRKAPAIWLPYKKMGQSVADLALDETGGRFGPYAGQFFTGDQLACTVERVFLEKIAGEWQGACFPFVEGLQSGVNRLAFAPDGSLFVGETDRGWGSTGRKTYGLQRIVYAGATPFEILAMRAEKDGFELEFTLDVEKSSALDTGSYSMTRYTYEYHSDYGCLELQTARVNVVSAELRSPRKIKLVMSEMRTGFVHELHAEGVRSAEAPKSASSSGAATPPGSAPASSIDPARDASSTSGASRPLLHSVAYYTLNQVPGAAAPAKKLPRVLFLTHSAGFVHDVVKRPDPFVLSLAEERFSEFGKADFEITCTQDCAQINAKNLANFDAVLFYTTGELPIADDDRTALMEWIKAGHAFGGVHCATDTLYKFAPYQELIAGTFDGHPWHQKVRIKVEDKDSPATKHLGDSFEVEDEIYQFKNWKREGLHVLMSLDTKSIDATKGKRADGDYATAWTKDWGKGRVFYTALGHEPALWKDERFQKHLLGGLHWAIDEARKAAAAK